MVDIYWLGQACFKIRGKNATIVTDPYHPEIVGFKLPKTSADIVMVTHQHEDHNNVAAIENSPVIVSGPGEYEIKDVQIVGLPAFHDKEKGSQRGKMTLYRIVIDGLVLAHLGDLGHKLSDTELEELGNVDILMLPVGGVYTLDAKEAAEVVAQVEPKIVLPMHYKIPELKFELGGLDKFFEEMGKEFCIAEPKLSVSREKLPEELEVVVLEKV